MGLILPQFDSVPGLRQPEIRYIIKLICSAAQKKQEQVSMKIWRGFGLLISYLICLAWLSACLEDQPKATNQTTDAATIYTQAAQTVVAGMTETISSDITQKTQIAQTEEARIDLAVQTLSARMTTEANTNPTATPTITPSAEMPPTNTPTPLPTSALANCNRVDFLGDVSTGNEVIFYPGEVFRKTWRLQNVGTCTWTPDYRLEMVSGDFQGGTSIALSDYVRPGQTIDLTFALVAPYQPGNYIGYWNLKNNQGQYFGLGPNGETPITLQAVVLEGGALVSYDFAANFCAAEWRSRAGILPCQGFDNEENGFVVFTEYPQLENGLDTGPALWMHPYNSYGGWISGAYPAIPIRRGDRFKAKVGCLVESPNCDVTLQVEYELMNGVVRTLGQWRETYDGQVTAINLDISPLAGEYVKFIFTVTAQNNQPEDANGVWVYPRIGQ